MSEATHATVIERNPFIRSWELGKKIDPSTRTLLEKPYNLDELDPAGLLPERVYTKEELRTYLEHGRKKGQAILEELTDEQARRLCRFPWGELSYLELLLDSMRHVQEHGAQLNMFLGQERGTTSRWKVKG